MVRWIFLLATISLCFCERRSREIDRYAVKMTHQLVDIFLSNERTWMIPELLTEHFEMDMCNRTIHREEFIDSLWKFPEISLVKYRMYNAFSHSTLPIINFTIHLDVLDAHYDVEISLEYLDSENSYQFLYFALANCHHIKRHNDFKFVFVKP